MKVNNNIIKELSNSYLNHKNILDNHITGKKKRPYSALRPSCIVVKDTEESAASLSERDHFIIFNEVILGKRGKEYMGYMSQATYYRHRKEAYKNFIERLKR